MASPSPSSLTASLLPQVEGYDLIEEIGRGGMGVVYKARQKSLQRTVALKMILAGAFATEDDRERFRTEAVAVARLNHPHLLSIYEIGYQDGLPFFSMEYLDAGSLTRFLRGRPVKPTVAAQLVRTLAEAMDYAHRQGVIHRDLKPANILFQSPDGASSGGGSTELVHLVPKITDFGLAKQLHAERVLTRTGDVLGTPDYMAPEQAAGNKTVGPASDVYSLGAILYELITGRAPFAGSSPAETLLKVTQEDPPAPRTIVRHLPVDLETICLKSLEKDPAQRYGTAQALADDLGRFLNGEAIEARKPGLWPRAIKWLRRHPAKSVLAAAALVILVLAIAWATELWRRARVEAEAGRTLQAERDKALLDTERLLAEALLDRGIFMAERGDRARGLQWMVRSLEITSRVEEKLGKPLPLSTAIRRSLTAWSHHFFAQPVELPHKDWVLGVAFSADGALAATAGKDRVVQVWDGYSGKKRGPALHHGGPVQAVAFEPQGRFLFTVSGDFRDRPQQLRVYEATGMPGEPFRQRGHPALLGTQGVKLAISPDGRRLLVILAEPQSMLFEFTPEGPDNGLALVGLVRHTGWIHDALFTPDGKTLLTIGRDGFLRRWHARDATQAGDPFAFPGSPDCIALRSDGNVAAIGGELYAAKAGSILGGIPDEAKSSRGLALLVDLAKGTRLGPPMFHQGAVKTVAFSSDGQLLATGSSAFDPEVKKSLGVVRLFHAESRHALLGMPFGRKMPHPLPVWSLAFSPDSRILITGSEDRAARFLSVAEQTLLAPAIFHEGTVASVVVNAKTGRVLTSSRSDHAAARLWDLPRLPESAPPLALAPVDEKTANSVHAVAWEADGEHLWVAARRGAVQRWHAHTGRLVDEVPLQSEEEALEVVVLPRDNALLVLCGNVVYRWSIERRRIEFTSRPLRPDGQTMLAVSPEANFFFLASKEHRVIQRYSAASGEKIGDEFSMDGSLRGLAISPDGRLLATSEFLAKENRNRVVVRGTADLAILQSWEHSTHVSALTFSPDGDTLITGGDDRLAQAWSIRTGKLRLAPFVLDRPVEFLAVNPAGDVLAVAGVGGPTTLWDLDTARPLGPHFLQDRAVRRVAFRRDGKVLLVGSQTDGKAYFFHVPPAVDASVQHLRLWVETLTRMELTESDVILPLSSAALTERRERLRELGGPPYDPNKSE